jgi:hypothetical protein
MQLSLTAEPTRRNIKAADVADFAEVAKIVEAGVSLTARLAQDQAAMARPLVADWKPAGL